MFNALLEGTYFHDTGSYLKLLKKNIPLGVTKIQDPRENLFLFGRTVNFQEILPHGETEERELSLQNRQSLSFGEGIILPPYRDDLELINMDTPRLLCMRDGRIFLTEEAQANQEYMQGLESLLYLVQNHFQNLQTKAYFNHYKSLFK